MSTNELIHLLEVIVWPIISLVAILAIRPALAALLSGAKVKLSFGGQAIETTLPELKQILEEQTGEPLSAEHLAYLNSLQKDGVKQYPSGIEKGEERKFLRPLRYSGLVQTNPRNAFLQDARAIEITGLGRIYLRASSSAAKK